MARIDLNYNTRNLRYDIRPMDSFKQILEYQIISFGDQAVTAGHVAAVPMVFVVGFIFLQWLIRIV
jgi:hypothetical protein